MEPPYRDALIEADPEWGEPEIWGTMRQVAKATSPNFFLAALDYTHTPDGKVVPVPEDRQVYVMLFTRTFLLSGLITLLCLVLGFPVAHLLATLPVQAPGEGTGRAYCTRLDAGAQKLTAPLQAWGLSSLEEVVY